MMSTVPHQDVMLSVFLSGNALVSINVVTLHRARLVREWVTVLERVNHLGAETAAHVNSAWPSLSGQAQ